LASNGALPQSASPTLQFPVFPLVRASSRRAFELSLRLRTGRTPRLLGRTFICKVRSFDRVTRCILPSGTWPRQLAVRAAFSKLGSNPILTGDPGVLFSCREVPNLSFRVWRRLVVVAVCWVRLVTLLGAGLLGLVLTYGSQGSLSSFFFKKILSGVKSR
jgi:hypothetical protein